MYISNMRLCVLMLNWRKIPRRAAAHVSHGAAYSDTQSRI